MMLELKGWEGLLIICQEKLWKHFGVDETGIPRRSVQPNSMLSDSTGACIFEPFYKSGSVESSYYVNECHALEYNWLSSCDTGTFCIYL